MIWMYFGLFYISGKDQWYMENIDWLFIPSIFIPSFSVVLIWFMKIQLQCLVALYKTNIKLFKILTLNLLDINEFYVNHIMKEEQA